MIRKIEIQSPYACFYNWHLIFSRVSHMHTSAVIKRATVEDFSNNIDISTTLQVAVIKGSRTSPWSLAIDQAPLWRKTEQAQNILNHLTKTVEFTTARSSFTSLHGKQQTLIILYPSADVWPRLSCSHIVLDCTRLNRWACALHNNIPEAWRNRYSYIY